MQNQRVLSFKAEAELVANVTDIKWFLVYRFQLYSQTLLGIGTILDGKVWHCLARRVAY